MLVARRRDTQFPLAKDWGRQVRARRVALGLSQTQFAELLDVTQQYISAVESGSTVPTDAMKQRLAERSGTRPWLLFTWPGQKAA